MDNSGKVWLIHTRLLTITHCNNAHVHFIYTQTHARVERVTVVIINKYSALNGKLWFALVAISLKFNRNMRDIEHAMWAAFCSFTINTLSRLYEVYFVKHVLQASTASSHRVGKCIIEPSKQSRIRKSSFWSHRRSTVQWETALSSKERSRRVNCPMLVPFIIIYIIYYIYYIYNLVTSVDIYTFNTTHITW